MILVTVGGTSHDFTRLVKEMDKISKKTDEKVIILRGKTKYTPEYAEYHGFVSQEKIEEFYQNSRVIVGHAGIGTIISAYKFKTPIVVIPRRKKYNEHIDDHQMEIAKKLEEEGIGIVVFDVENLESAIESIDNKKMKKPGKEKTLVKNLKEYLSKLEGTIK